MTIRRKIIALLLVATLSGGAGLAYHRSRPRIVDLRVPATERCPLHGVSLAEETISNHYGISIEYMAGYLEARARLFPMANNDPAGVKDQKVSSILRSYCPRCREESSRWVKEQYEGPAQGGP